MFALASLPDTFIAPLFLGVITCFSFVVLKRCRLSGPSKQLPPGPKPLPFLGNVLDLPKDYWWIKFSQWSKEYGDVVHINVLGQHIVILNSVNSIRELLDRRSAIYSDRPAMTMLGELMGWNWSFTIMKYGSAWRHHRKMFQQCFNVEAITRYHELQTLEARKTARRLIESPQRFIDHIGLYFTGNIMRIVYGIDVKDVHDPFYQVSKFMLGEVAEAAAAGRFLVDVLPILKYVPAWFPGASFQRKALKSRRMMPSLRVQPYKITKKATYDDTYQSPSIVADYLRAINCELGAEEEEVLIDVAAVSNSAGSDTTVSTLQSFFLAMSLFPDVQRKAREQIDEVVGRDRLPEFEDLDYLPYVHAIFKESLRWQPVLPIGGPHRLMQDDEYEGYYIPKGTLVFGNTWALLHDKDTYPDPNYFRPERFLNRDGTLNPNVQDPDIAAFGYGRRKCPGRYFAANGALITIATVLATVEILSEACAPTEVKLDSKSLMTGDAMSYPKPFKCKIRPCSPGVVELVTQYTSAQ